MNIEKSTRSYEAWLRKQTDVIDTEIDFKHEQMSTGVFPFFRATFYRWLQVWEEQCRQENDAPRVLSVGDLHIENFGTWRDAEGRLAWGVNDFDEAWPLPYTQDLVRLAASALVSQCADGSALTPKAICDAILGGYADAIEAGGRPFVLSERHPTLSALAHSELRNPIKFWQNMQRQPGLDRKKVPASAIKALEAHLPEPVAGYRVIHQVKGMGSLGRHRFAALTEHRGGFIAREAKALVPSACAWHADEKNPAIHYPAMIAGTHRCPDPLFKVKAPWIVRRLAPDCSRIELTSLTHIADEVRVLRAMGWEVANVHLGQEDGAKSIRKDLRHRPVGWLRAAAKGMAKAVQKDWADWKARNPRHEAQ